MVRRRRGRRALSGRAPQGGPGRPRAGHADAVKLATTVAKPDAAVAIAVLPFSDMSSAKDQEYLCEGMAEEIMNALVRVDGIRVASRTSAFRARQGGERPARDRPCPFRKSRPRGQRTDIGWPASSHRAAHRCRERLPALVGAVRPGRHRRLRDPGRDRRGRRGRGEGAPRTRLANGSRSTAGP